jgi:hypothetical protein
MAEVLAHQAIAYAPHPRAMPRIGARVRSEIALRVDSHRTAGDVRRSDADEAIVDDHHL